MHDPKDPEKINTTPPLEEVTDAYLEVIKHNEQYTSVAAAFRNIAAAVLNGRDESKIEPDYIDNEHPAVVEGDMDAELQSLFHGDTFARIGIRLYPVGGETVRSLRGRRIASTELEPFVANTQLYLDFLRQQTKEGVNRQDERLKLMVDVLTTLCKIIKISYEEGVKDQPGSSLLLQNGEDALRTFIAIDEQYRRLGIDGPGLYAEYLREPRSDLIDETLINRQTAEKYQKTYQDLQTYVHNWGDMPKA